MKKIWIITQVIFFVCGLSFAQMNAPTHLMVNKAQVKWAPSDFPGVQMAVMDGDPSVPGSNYTIWMKVPSGYKFPPHWHPQDEHLIILEGTFAMGLGDKFDESKVQELNVGGFAMIPKKLHHFAWAKTDTVFAIYGIGPFQVIFVNPADDPRSTKTQ